MKKLSVLFAALLISLAICHAVQAAPPKSVALTAGTTLTQNATIKPGTYALIDTGQGAVRITGHDITIDFRDASLHGDSKGNGIVIADARNITLKNAHVSGYTWGITVQNSQGIKIIKCEASHNADLPTGTVIDESGSEPQDEHGGGFVLRDCRHCLLSQSSAQHEWDAVDMVRSDDNQIQDCDLSYNSNWGVHLWASSRNTVQRNRAVWCTTGAGTLYQALTGWQTYDAEAICIEHNSNDNTIAQNDLREGGDGIFIRANEGPLTPNGPPVPVLNGSHRNRLLNNDCSYSPNNAIEVDLVDDTVISGNNCSHSNYGMWLGISQRCIVKNNLCVDDADHAVEIERGQNDQFEANTFGFTSPRPDSLVYLRKNGDEVPSGPYTLTGNLFFGAKIAVQLVGTPATFQGNTVAYRGADGPAQLVVVDAASPVTDQGDNRVVDQAMTVPPFALHSLPLLAENAVRLVSPAMPKPGDLVTLAGKSLAAAQVLIEGKPADILKATGTELQVRLPSEKDDVRGVNLVVIPKGGSPLWPLVVSFKK